MATSRALKAKEAPLGVREFYNIGVKSLDELGKRAAKERIEEAARTLGMNPFTLRKARQCADAEKGYSEEELGELCRQLDSSGAAGRAFGYSHLILLLAAPKATRPSLQERAIKEGWTFRTLRGELAKQPGRRRRGGKRPRMPDDLLGTYAQIDSECHRWIRWHSDLTDLLKKAPFAKMHGKMWSLLQEVTELFTELQGVVDRALQRNKTLTSQVEQE